MSVRAWVDAVGATSTASVSADSFVTLQVAFRAVTALPLDLATATTGLRVADELRAVFQWSVDAVSAPVLGSGAKRMRLDPAPLALLHLPPDVLLLVFRRLDSRSLVRIAATCSRLYRDPQRPMTLVEEALRERAVVRGYVTPVCLPEGAISWVSHLAWLERRRDEAWAPLAARTSSSFFVAEGGHLMCCGTEDAVYDEEERVAAGVLGHGDINGDNFIVKTPTCLPSTTGIRISCVSAGLGFSAAVSAAGNVYTWGEGDEGQLGHGDEKSSLIPKEVRGLAGHLIRSVATSSYHCIAVTERGEVFSWGLNSHGQCGHGNSGDNLLLPRRIEALSGVRVRSSSAGRWHSLVVTEEGTLYSFGAGPFGQLGHGNFHHRFDPAIVDALLVTRIVATAAGDHHSIALNVDGIVFCWGKNHAGQLGLGRVGESTALPQKVDALINVCAVVAADFASCAITTTGELFTWGNGESGRLGHGDDADQLAPKRVETLRNEWVVAVTCGECHTIAAARDGGVFGWGYVKGLGLPEADATAPNDGYCVVFPRRYRELSCIP